MHWGHVHAATVAVVRLLPGGTLAADPAGSGGLALTASPNPARARSAVAFDLGESGPVRVMVLDALGRRVATVHDGPLTAGLHTFTLDASRLAPGIYVVHVESGSTSAARRFTVVR